MLRPDVQQPTELVPSEAASLSFMPRVVGGKQRDRVIASKSPFSVIFKKRS
jgi:hypothetical protein